MVHARPGPQPGIMRRQLTGIVLSLLVGATAAVGATPGPAPSTTGAAVVVAALDRAAHPLRTVEPSGEPGDLRPLDRMTGDARVAGLGEATHGSHEFFALKDRVFRHLVEADGFRTFALEAPWSTGQLLNDYVRYGKGDPRRIMDEEFQSNYLWWNNTDYLRLVEWMRSYDIEHPDDPVLFLGDDIAWTGPEVYDAVTGYVAATHPGASARLAALYKELRPTVAAGAYLDAYPNTPYAERVAMARRTGEALALVEGLGPGADREAYARVVQDARVIDRTARQYAFDFTDQAQLAAAMRYRDATMAANVLWWQRHTGTKVLLSAHDNHVGYEPQDPVDHPKTQGAFLRDSLGAGYVSVGLTFGRGSFNATGPDGTVRRWTLGPAQPGTNEATLDRVRARDYVVDLRSVAAPARAWLATARPTRTVGTAYPDGPYDIALGRSYDVLVHLHAVTAARPRGERPPPGNPVAEAPGAG
ncbi:Erythromycin esterase [Actinobacteria bacterium OK074]|nr:Erythromycin esterase [Actinobacteria bacterium OK074]